MERNTENLYLKKLTRGEGGVSFHKQYKPFVSMVRFLIISNKESVIFQLEDAHIPAW